MKANPGGNIDPKNVYGRDHLIARLWEQLDPQCLLMNAERRIGKTSMLRKMANEPAAGWFPIYMDLEKFHSAEEFAIAVYDQLHGYLNTKKRILNLARKLFEEYDFGGFKSTTGARPWKKLLTAAIQDLLSEKSDERVVFLWDEVPYMIDNIRQKDGEQAAIEVLDTLRSLRQENPLLRMVYTGSVGLHHVLDIIRAGKRSTEPINDMLAVEVPPLDREDAIKLAIDLIEGERLSASDPRKSAEVLADEADCFPFYIHHIVAGLRREGLQAEPDDVRTLVACQLVDSDDPWDLGHYRTRISAYYRNDKDAERVNLILDALATAPAPLSLKHLQEAINASTPDIDDRSELVRILRLMERDHYLAREPDGRIRFRFPLIQRWWKLDRGL